MAFIASALTLVVYAFIIAIFIRVIFSWISPNPSNRIYKLTYDITEPVLAPVRNLLPGRGLGMDFSPMIVTLLLYMVLNFVRRFS